VDAELIDCNGIRKQCSGRDDTDHLIEFMSDTVPKNLN